MGPITAIDMHVSATSHPLHTRHLARLQQSIPFANTVRWHSSCQRRNKASVFVKYITYIIVKTIHTSRLHCHQVLTPIVRFCWNSSSACALSSISTRISKIIEQLIVKQSFFDARFISVPSCLEFSSSTTPTTLELVRAFTVPSRFEDESVPSIFIILCLA